MAKEEALTFESNNVTRVTPKQQAFVRFKADGRYTPVKVGATQGIVLLKDKEPTKAVDFVNLSLPKGPLFFFVFKKIQEGKNGTENREKINSESGWSDDRRSGRAEPA